MDSCPSLTALSMSAFSFLTEIENNILTKNQDRKRPEIIQQYPQYYGMPTYPSYYHEPMVQKPMI